MKRLALIGSLLCSSTFGQTAKTPIEINCSSKPGDTIGAQFCSAMRDNLATSPRYSEVTHNPDGYSLRVMTVAIDENVDTAISTTLIWNGYFITSMVQTCGSTVVTTCARTLFSGADEGIMNFEKSVDEMRASQKK